MTTYPTILPSKSCISDRPIYIDSDALGNNKYALGLLGFIRQADTPVTIGIQGGWGSGKTSLINILQHQLEKQGDTLCVFVNAWEHSLFQNESDKSGVAVSLLSGVVEAICTVVEEKAKLPADNLQRITEAVKVEALREDSSLKKIGKFTVGLVAQSVRMGAKYLGDVDMPAGSKEGAQESRPSGARFIRELRSDLTHAVQTVVDKSAYKRFVCFVDDLDRVHPTIAIEILDVLKNVFDVPHCVFVLAIDYDVVVKGLEMKFGPKTLENEREFRQYFDKIIQVPFSMPVGAYADKMEKLLLPHFISLGLPTTNLARMAQVALQATDGIPRGVKRIVNTLSLLRLVQEQSEANQENREVVPEHLEILFIVVALQINFPEIYRRLVEAPQFDKWTPQYYQERWQLLEFLDEENNTFDTDALAEQYGETFDEPWEQVVYLLCQRNSWLKQKAVNVSVILNLLLREVLPSCESGKGLEYLQEALNAVNVTAVDTESSIQVEGVGPKNDEFTQFCKTAHKKLVNQLAPHGFKIRDPDPKTWAKKHGGGKNRCYPGNDQGITLDYTGFSDWQLRWAGDSLDIAVELKPMRGKTAEFRKYVNDNLPSNIREDYERPDQYLMSLDGYEIFTKATPATADDAVKQISDFILTMKKITDEFM